jgi:hypothetical protein
MLLGNPDYPPAATTTNGSSVTAIEPGSTVVAPVTTTPAVEEAAELARAAQLLGKRYFYNIGERSTINAVRTMSFGDHCKINAQAIYSYGSDVLCNAPDCVLYGNRIILGANARRCKVYGTVDVHAQGADPDALRPERGNIVLPLPPAGATIEVPPGMLQRVRVALDGQNNPLTFTISDTDLAEPVEYLRILEPEFLL